MKQRVAGVTKTRSSRKTRYSLSPGLEFPNDLPNNSEEDDVDPNLSTLGEEACRDMASDILKDIIAKSVVVAKSTSRKQVSKQDIGLVQCILLRNASIL